MIRAANYLSVTVMDRTDQPALRSVQWGAAGTCVAAAWLARAGAGDARLKRRLGKKVSGF